MACVRCILHALCMCITSIALTRRVRSLGAVVVLDGAAPSLSSIKHDDHHRHSPDRAAFPLEVANGPLSETRHRERTQTPRISQASKMTMGLGLPRLMPALEPVG